MRGDIGQGALPQHIGGRAGSPKRAARVRRCRKGEGLADSRSEPEGLPARLCPPERKAGVPPTLRTSRLQALHHAWVARLGGRDACPPLRTKPGSPALRWRYDGTTLALTRCWQARDRGMTRHLSHGLRIGFAWASHRLRMGFARVYMVFHAPSHPSSWGTMALVVWKTLPM